MHEVGSVNCALGVGYGCCHVLIILWFRIPITDTKGFSTMYYHTGGGSKNYNSFLPGS